RAAEYSALVAGSHTLRVKLEGEAVRQVALRLPAGYDPQQAWPLIYALHGSVGGTEFILDYLERVLGEAIERFVIAAPRDYGQYVIHAYPPVSTEHLTVLREIKRLVHVDSDRVYLTGYSRGGHASWTLGTLHAEQFAAVAPIAGTLIAPVPRAIWPLLLPNLTHTAVLNVWGELDTDLDDGRMSPDGGLAAVNRKLRRVAGELGLPLASRQIAGVGHLGVVPPRAEMLELLERRRIHFPEQVRHRFRHLYQGKAYWLEARRLTGSQWSDRLTIRRGPRENIDAAIARALRAQLGELRGSIEGQKIDVRRRQVDPLVVWFGDGMIDWNGSVVLEASRVRDFRGQIEPDLLICLLQAARTRDFERLHWAGLHVPTRGEISRLSAEELDRWLWP
ncbi:MAG: hypothetical protein JSV80_08785, partial [Acidobacteriota bacterium]